MFREMRRKKQALPPEECAEILRRGTSGVLAVLGDGGAVLRKIEPVVHAERHLDERRCVKQRIFPDEMALARLVLAIDGNLLSVAQDDEIYSVVLAEGGIERARNVRKIGLLRIVGADPCPVRVTAEHDARIKTGLSGALRIEIEVETVGFGGILCVVRDTPVRLPTQKDAEPKGELRDGERRLHSVYIRLDGGRPVGDRHARIGQGVRLDFVHLLRSERKRARLVCKHTAAHRADVVRNGGRFKRTVPLDGGNKLRRVVRGDGNVLRRHLLRSLGVRKEPFALRTLPSHNEGQKIRRIIPSAAIKKLPEPTVL